MTRILPIFALLLILLCGWGLIRYHKSSILLDQGNQLLKQDRVEEATNILNKAHSTFPFRQDVTISIRGAQLVQKSGADFGKISEIDAEIENAELQNIPPVTEIPKEEKVKAYEILAPILMYHHIRVNPMPNSALWASLNVSANQLDNQLQYLATHGFHPILPEQLLDALNSKASLPTKPVIISFDDGYRNFYENAFPLLKKYNFKAIEFVITGVTPAPAYLSWDQIIEMDKSGLIEFGAHTRHHPDLTRLSASAQVDEIKGSKADLESHLKKQVNFFAYPYGSYNNLIVQEVKDSGYLGAASVIYGSVQSPDKLYLMPRIMVDGRFSIEDFANRLPQ